jgi:chorismate synthase
MAGKSGMSKKTTYVISGIALAAVVVGLVIAIMYYIDTQKRLEEEEKRLEEAKKRLEEELRKPIVLVDETKYIPWLGYQHISTVFSKGTKIDVEIKVVEGGPLDVLLFDSKGFLEFERFMKNEINSVSYIKIGSSLNVKSKNYDFIIPEQDRYFIVINNAGGIEGGARPVGDVSVHIKVTYVIP